MKEVFVINGSGGSGKDSFVERTMLYAKVCNFSSIDIVKDAARIFGWDGGKTDKDRKFLSDMKDLAIEYNDAPLKSVMGGLNEFLSSDQEIMFVHIREIPEIVKFLYAAKGLGVPVRTILVTNPNVDVITSNKSDSGVFNYVYDITITNDGTLEDLESKALKFINDLNQR